MSRQCEQHPGKGVLEMQGVKDEQKKRNPTFGNPPALQRVLLNKRSQHKENPVHHRWRVDPALLD